MQIHKYQQALQRHREKKVPTTTEMVVVAVVLVEVTLAEKAVTVVQETMVVLAVFQEEI